MLSRSGNLRAVPQPHSVLRCSQQIHDLRRSSRIQEGCRGGERSDIPGCLVPETRTSEWSSGRFTVREVGGGGQLFLLQSSEDFSRWTDVTSGILTSESLEFLDADAPSFPYRFYRALPEW